MIVTFGNQADQLCSCLQENGYHATSFLPNQVPSLTALLLQDSTITDIVLLDGAEHSWSMGHILAAAKQLQGKGRMFFLGPHSQQPALITVVPDAAALLRLLQKPEVKNDGGSGGRPAPPLSPVPETREVIRIQPMQIPSDKILILGVVGSQHRIGCTTQAVGLWHYCKALGFDPAIVSSPGQIAEIASPMHSQEIPGGYQIEGIPFVTDTAQAYDCYILDIGPGNIQEALRATDYLVLVAGSKPWELQHTAAALRAARGHQIQLLLSFSSQSDARTLQPLFGHQSAAVLPWMPELWQPSMAAMAVYESILRPILDQLLSRHEEQPNSELSPTKDID